MIVAQIRIGGEGEPALPLHPALTVLSGLDPAARRALATALIGALRGNPADVEVEIEVDGKREWLGPGVLRRLGLEASNAVVLVEPTALPGAAPPPAPAGPAPPAAGTDGVAAIQETAEAAEAAKAAKAAAATVAEAEAALAAAVAGAAAASDAAAAVSAGEADGDEPGAGSADAAVAAASARLEQARQDLAAAREALVRAEAATTQEQAKGRAAAAEQERVAQTVKRLVRDQTELEQTRAELLARLATSVPQDPGPVEQALEELRRLKAVKPIPSAAAAELAERWVAVRTKLVDLPVPPEPPQWLVAPALAALQEAREALARAEGGASDTTPDPGLVEALDRAHRQVLEAEQKMMRKGSRLHRRRLDQAYEAERAALAALDVGSYGEYLRRVAPADEVSSSSEDPAAAARAALADAEAVWEELHGGLASPEWTAAKAEEGEVRNQAHELLGRPVPDSGLAAALRGHREDVVDVGWAEEALAHAIGAGSGERASGPDLEQAAQRWLGSVAEANQARAELERRLTELDQRLEVVIAELSEHQADAFFGTDDSPAGRTEDDADEARQRVSTATSEVQKAEQEAREAQAALVAAEEQAARRREQLERRAHLRGEAEAAADAVRAAEASLGEARRAAEAAASSATEAAMAAESAKAASAPVPTPAGPQPDLRGVTALEAEIYLLARLTAVQGAPEGPLPLFVDATAVAGLPEPAAGRVLALLERAAGPVQVVLLGDDGPVGEWARRKGADAAVVAAAETTAHQSRR